jgi:2-oxoglutarate ferredoxin oxidoreductase subunit alpha
MSELLEGSDAMAQAAIVAGCRFFAGYPMTPFTELLEQFAKRLPPAGGVCINAESELEAVGMAWGALATGARAATGSTGQGLSLMQESFAEITLAELPLVIFNMARGQGDYFQSTRGGGHGDYRHLVLAPVDLAEAVELVQLAFHLADRWRNPVLVHGDYLLAHLAESVDVRSLDFGPAPQKEWAADGRRGGTGLSALVSPLGLGKHRTAGPGGAPGPDGPGIEGHQQAVAAKLGRIAAGEARCETAHCEDAELVVAAFGVPAKFVRFVVEDLRAAGHRVGFVRPITLWPFPAEAVAAACARARTVAVFEINAGQMIDDVRLAVLGRAPVVGIGGISTDRSGFGVGSLLDVDVIRARIEAVLATVEVAS